MEGSSADDQEAAAKRKRDEHNRSCRESRKKKTMKADKLEKTKDDYIKLLESDNRDLKKEMEDMKKLGAENVKEMEDMKRTMREQWNFIKIQLLNQLQLLGQVPTTWKVNGKYPGSSNELENYLLSQNYDCQQVVQGPTSTYMSAFEAGSFDGNNMFAGFDAPNNNLIHSFQIASDMNCINKTEFGTGSLVGNELPSAGFGSPFNPASIAGFQTEFAAGSSGGATNSLPSAGFGSPFKPASVTGFQTEFAAGSSSGPTNSFPSAGFGSPFNPASVAGYQTQFAAGSSRGATNSLPVTPNNNNQNSDQYTHDSHADTGFGWKKF